MSKMVRTIIIQMTDHLHNFLSQFLSKKNQIQYKLYHKIPIYTGYFERNEKSII